MHILARVTDNGSRRSRDDTDVAHTSSFASADSAEKQAQDVEVKGGDHDDEEALGTSDEPVDPDVVDFEGDNDPARAVNWPARKKWGMISVLSAMTLITPLASSMFAPGVGQVMSEFQNDSLLLSGFVVSVYILGYATGPLVIAPFSELYGRSITYHVSNSLFVIFTIACAVSSSLGMLIAFRFLAGIAGSCVLTNGGGTIGDLFVQEKRGGAMAIWSMGPLLGPVVGPVAGGFLTEAEGWRWVFWVIAIASGVLTVICFFVLQESYSITILETKTRKLRKATGNPRLRSKLDHGLTPTAAFARALIRPAKMLISPIVLLLSTYNAIVYGYLYLLFTTISAVFEDGYGFSTGTVGLTYLGIGIGMFLSLFVFGGISDRLLKAKAAKGEMKPEYRLPPMIPGAFLVPAGLFIYGWTAQYRVHWIVPILGTGLVGAGLLATFMSIQTYLVDAYTVHASSAMAANTILRSLLGALLPLAGPSMYRRLGLGWGNSLLGFIALLFLPLPFVFYRYGERIRKSERWQPSF